MAARTNDPNVTTNPTKTSHLLLVVEDDPHLRRLVVRTLETKGYRTHAAENGLVAKEFFDLNQADVSLIISDVRMPELDGLQLLEYVRSKSQVPFIIMTGFSEALETKSVLTMGADQFVAKPFRTSILLEAVMTCLEKSTPSK